MPGPQRDPWSQRAPAREEAGGPKPGHTRTGRLPLERVAESIRALGEHRPRGQPGGCANYFSHPAGDPWCPALLDSK